LALEVFEPAGLSAAELKLREQDGADQPATAPKSRAEGTKKTKPEAEVRSQ
jgi:hypothetical protein